MASGKTARQLEELVAGRSLGDSPDSPPAASARRQVLRFEVAAETCAVFRQALAELRRRSGSSLDEDAALMEMARHVLGGPADEGRASYQIALTVCTECETGRQHAGADAVAVGSDVVAMASCDAQHLGRVDIQPANDAPPVHVGHRATLDVQPTAEAASTQPARRAKQAVPPSVRRAVLRRDQGRCRVPGCRNACFLDVHHLALRSEGGSHRAENLIAVCGAHHRALSIAARSPSSAIPPAAFASVMPTDPSTEVSPIPRASI